MSCIDADHIALLVSRQQSTPGFRHALVIDAPADMFCISNKSREGQTAFPLYAKSGTDLFLGGVGREWSINISQEFSNSLLNGGRLGHDKDRWTNFDGAQSAFDYVYAVLHSPEYRRRYAELLKMEYPRIPVASESALSEALANYGRELISLHLVRSQVLGNPISSPVGFGDFQVEKVSYSDETVWIDKAKTRGFKGVPEEVWNFHIGGYQVCEKWLKDRQAKGGKNPRPGRILTDEDIEHYQKIVVALSETIRIMAEIDEVIEVHGGWPGAFQMVDAGDEPVSDVVYAKADDDTTQLDMVAEPKDG